MEDNSRLAQTQWSIRPVDHRFWGLDDLTEAARKVAERSVERLYRRNTLKMVNKGGKLGLTTTRIREQDLEPIGVSYHAEAQLAQSVSAPISYLRQLPVDLAAECLNSGLQRYDDSVGTLVYNRQPNGGEAEWVVRSVASERYERIWTYKFLSGIKEMIEDSPNAAHFRVPPAWPNAPDPRTRLATAEDVGPWTLVKEGDDIAPAGAYYSPETGKDTFLFMLNTDKVIDMPEKGVGFRALILYNSESRAGKVGGMTCVINAACGNHYLLGMRDVKEFSFRHIGDSLTFRTTAKMKSIMGVMDDAPWETEVFGNASRRILGKTTEEVVETVVKSTKLSQRSVMDALMGVSQLDYGNPFSAYAVSSALTEQSQRLGFIEDRMELDTAAAKLLN